MLTWVLITTAAALWGCGAGAVLLLRDGLVDDDGRMRALDLGPAGRGSGTSAVLLGRVAATLN
ncbi:hypothetical protein ACWD3Z_36690 [Streptomyces sp. NPDC002740]